jgi:parvulin-like peptidyl-prolyl isomerase
MKKRVFSRFYVAATVTAAIAASLLAMPAAYGEIVNGIAVKVGNAVVTVNEFNSAYSTARKQALLLGSEAPSKKAVMDELVDDTLVRVEGERRGIIVTEDEVNDIINEIKKQNKFDDEQMNEQLALEGLTLKDLKAQYSRELMKARLINLMGAEKTAGISEDAVREFYDDPANRERLSIPGTGSVRLSRILVPVPASATYKEALDIKNEVTSVYEQAKKGEDFQSLVQSHSSTPDKAGMGTFTQEQLLPLFPVETVNLIFSLEKGDVAPPMRVKDGYMILKVEEKNPEKMLSYEEARENIRGYLFKQKGDEQFVAWIKEKRQMTRIEYMTGME